MPERISLRDIAQQAGVHFSTVSLALKNSPRLSLETRERVRRIAADLGYRHDPWLDALLAYRDTKRRQKHPTVLAYVSSWDAPIETLPHHRFFWRGAGRKADELGMKLESFSLAEKHMSTERLEKILAARGIECLILSSFSEGAERLEFDWSKLAAVRIEFQPSWPPMPTVSVDHLRIIQEAFLQVLRLGYRRPGLVVGHNWSRLVEDHWQIGFSWCQQQLAAEDRIPPLATRFEDEAGPAREAFAAWLAAHAPDVILGAHGAIEARLDCARERIPRSFALADPFLEQPHPFYAGVVHPLEAVGAKAVEQLLGMMTQNIRGIPAEVTRTYVDGRWSPGPSCPPAH